MADDPRNRRKYPRLKVSAKVTGRWRAPSGEEGDLEALLLWISEGGAQLRSAAPITGNSILRFTIKLGPFEKYEPTARVRWWRRAGEVRELGVEFADPIPKLGAYVRRKLAAQVEKQAEE